MWLSLRTLVMALAPPAGPPAESTKVIIAAGGLACRGLGIVAAASCTILLPERRRYHPETC